MQQEPKATLLGHPRGLRTLFFTEMWERFSYYGMRAILMLFMTAAVASGGMGLSPEEAGPIYAMYTSLVYLATVPGGWLADNFLGQRKSVLLGGIVIMCGHVLLAAHGTATFYAGLGCVVIGTGLLKPNISVIVGRLYGEKDVRREAGFSIFYMGINIGAFSAPLVCGPLLAESETLRGWLRSWHLDPNDAWHWGFGAAAVGMFLGVLQYVLTRRHLGEAGVRPTPRGPEQQAKNRRTLAIGIALTLGAAAFLAALAWQRPELLTKGNITTGYAWVLIAVVVLFFWRIFTAGKWTRAEWARLVLIAVLFLAAAIFWGVFEQAGSTLTLFAKHNTNNVVLGHDFGSAWWQSVNAALIVLLAPLFSILWLKLGDRNPSYPTKFALGLLFAGLGFLWLVGGARAASDGTQVGIHWLLGVYLLHTIGELCLSPVGLAAMTRLAPARVTSTMMGLWFLADSVGNFLGGSVASYYERFELPTLFLLVACSAFVMAALLFALVRPMRNMLARAEAEEARASLAAEGTRPA